MSADALTVQDALRIIRDQAPHLAASLYRDQMRDKSYQLLPMGQEAATYLRAKRKRLTESSYRDYEGCLDKFARHFPDLQLADFEPPVGTNRIEEFLDHQWGHREPRTYNKNPAILEVGGDGGNRTRAAFPEQNLSKTGVDRRAGGGCRIGREVVA